MRNRYRYIFGGHAIVAEIHKPNNECGILGATALPITGGCARVVDVGKQEWEIPGISGTNSFQSGSSFVSGELKTGDTRSYVKTITEASLNGLNLMGRVSVDALSVQLISEVGSDEDEPTFAFGNQERDPIQGLRVDGVQLLVEFDRAALHLALESLREKIHPLITQSFVKLSFPGNLASSKDVSIQRDHVLQIADAQIHFGELLIGPGFRNVTLFRLELGSEGRDNDSGVDVASGPQGWPP